MAEQGGRRAGSSPYGRMVTQREPSLPDGRMIVPDDEWPADGDQVWYKHWSWEWIPARVVTRVAAEDNEGMAAYYPPARRGCLHLRITLDPERHFSASDFGYRQHVSEGADEGQWQRQPPKDWERQKAEREMRQNMERDVRLQTWAASAEASGR